jgi:hypothetical protein
MLQSSNIPQKPWKCKLPKRTLFAAFFAGAGAYYGIHS